MKLPQLAKKPELKSCHDVTWEDNYSWIHQKDILEVLKDKEKLNPEVRKYLEEENSYTEEQLKDTKGIQKKLFDEFGVKIVQASKILGGCLGESNQVKSCVKGKLICIIGSIVFTI